MQFGQEPLKPTHQVPGIGDGLVILPHVFQIEADTPVYLFRNRWNTYILIIQVSEKMPYCPDSLSAQFHALMVQSRKTATSAPFAHRVGQHLAVYHHNQLAAAQPRVAQNGAKLKHINVRLLLPPEAEHFAP